MSLLPRLSEALRRVLDGFGKPSPVGRYAEQVELGTRLDQLAKLGESVDITGNNETVGADLIEVPDPGNTIPVSPKTVGNLLRSLYGAGPPSKLYVEDETATDSIAGGPTPIAGMSITPDVAGDYAVLFECTMAKGGGGTTQATLGIYVNGVLVGSTRSRSAGNSDGHMGISGTVSVNGTTDTVDIRATQGSAVDYKGRTLILVNGSL